jgi:tagatose-6-phosphate ketose/aldose isomerase
MGGATPTVPRSVDEWLTTLASVPGAFATLLRAPSAEQLARGYGHTIREMGQQPVTWIETAARLRALAPVLAECLAGAESVVFTGSGSSVYAGECVAPCLQAALGIPVTAVPAGHILTHPEHCLPPNGRLLVVSLARSGNSPESRAVVDWLLEGRPQAGHLFITCNSRGALATSYLDRPEVRVVVLDEKTDDRSLVMTSAFTNLVLAGRALGSTRDPAAGEARALGLARGAASLLLHETEGLRRTAESGFDSVAYLGSGCRLGSAREAALKMLEMNSGEVWTLAESYLAFRHGPMSALRPGTLLVALLSSDPLVRAYELDLLRELDRKGLAARRVVFGAELPAGLGAGPDALLVDGGAGQPCPDEDLAILDAVVGQLLAFFRCLHAGHRPDSPSEASVITRVVSGFEIHRRNGAR